MSTDVHACHTHVWCGKWPGYVTVSHEHLYESDNPLVARVLALWFWLHSVPQLLSPWLLTRIFTCGETAMYLGSPLRVFVIRDARDITLAWGNPKMVESQWRQHFMGWSHVPNKRDDRS